MHDVSPPPEELGSLVVNAVESIIGNSVLDADLNVPICRAVSTAAAEIPYPIFRAAITDTNNIAIIISLGDDDDDDDLPPPLLPYDDDDDDDWKKHYDPRYQARDGFDAGPSARVPFTGHSQEDTDRMFLIMFDINSSNTTLLINKIASILFSSYFYPVVQIKGKNN